MAQSKSNSSSIEIPKRTFTLEFFVGVFTIAGFAAVAYLAVGLGGLQIGQGDTYTIEAEFDNISGLKHGASVEIAGVKVGDVAGIKLEDPTAIVTIQMKNGVQIRDDDIFAIRTKGIIGDRYVKISRGGSDDFIPAGGRVIETESVVDIEDIIGKIVHSLSGDDEEEEGA